MKEKEKSLISKIIKVIKDHFAEKRKKVDLSTKDDDPFAGIPLPKRSWEE